MTADFKDHTTRYSHGKQREKKPWLVSGQPSPEFNKQFCSSIRRRIYVKLSFCPLHMVLFRQYREIVRLNRAHFDMKTSHHILNQKEMNLGLSTLG